MDPILPERNDSVYRTLGANQPWDRLGCGFLVKRGHRQDHTAYDPPTYSLVAVLSGRGEYEDADGVVHPLTAGSRFQRIPGRRHTTRIDPESGWTEFFIDLGSVLHRTCAGIPFFLPDRLVWQAGVRPDLFPRMQELTAGLREAAEGRLPRLYLDLLGLLLDLNQEVSSQDEDGRLVEDACRMLNGSADVRDGLVGLCRNQGVGYERFRKLFVRRLGMPPHRYRIQRRMDRACHLLMDSGDTVAQIAEKLGYSSPFEFSSQFRRHQGIAPTAYRRRMRPGG